MKMIVFLNLLFSFSFSFANATPSLTSMEGMNVLSGETVKLDLTGKKGSVVVFLSAKCPCSGSHEVVLNDLAKEYPDFIFVGVHSNADEDKTITKNHFAEAKLSFPVLQDSRSAWANQLGALKTPHAFVFNPKGELLYQGGVTDSHVGPAAKKTFLKDVLSDIQSGKAPRMKEGRALGCFIQREG